MFKKFAFIILASLLFFSFSQVKSANAASSVKIGIFDIKANSKNYYTSSRLAKDSSMVFKVTTTTGASYGIQQYKSGSWSKISSTIHVLKGKSSTYTVKAKKGEAYRVVIYYKVFERIKGNVYEIL
ncbi:hypothetical protein [Peribacillus frigoritolerans]|uniref:hypothetical protein n=1 Tax=Peribacillus frigoritolerans TaxID=450367 RepID=UPI00107080DD|nr:hypothetical protein [Peribacillus frigoritolerans]TFH61559.1 hypothetical protein E4J71_08910 [Peribacillus frigoritolerans]